VAWDGSSPPSSPPVAPVGGSLFIDRRRDQADFDIIAGHSLSSAPMAAEDPRSDEELMRAHVDGDPHAFRVIFDRYGPRLMGMARRRLPSEEHAREVVQQTFTQLHAARHDFRQGSKLRPWVFTIAMNLVRGHYRRVRRRPESELDAERTAGPVPEHGPLEAQERAQRLRQALQALPEGQREVVELHWFQERPFAEVASIVGASEGAVRVRAHRAYARLAELLREELGNK